MEKEIGGLVRKGKGGKEERRDGTNIGGRPSNRLVLLTPAVSVMVAKFGMVDERWAWREEGEEGPREKARRGKGNGGREVGGRSESERAME